jgi:hypothetical protein
MPGPLENLRDEFLMVLVDRLEYDTRQPLITVISFQAVLQILGSLRGSVEVSM